MEQPLGRAVGNALEVREAIETLSGHGPPDLEALSLRLGAEMLRMAGEPPTDLERLLSDGSALRKFAKLIEAQSGDRSVVHDLDRLRAAPVRRAVPAAESGQVAALDALEIALAAKSLGAGRDRKDAAIDLSVGVVLHKKVGDRVQAGESLATAHARTDDGAAKVTSRIAAAFALAASAQPRRLLLRRVTAAGIERLETLGDVDPNLVAVSVSPSSLVQRGGRTPVHVTVTYRQPISSPLLRVFLGETYVATGDAWSQ